jgi:hypothetical protein
MTPPRDSFPRPQRPKAAPPEQRSAELIEVQRRLKREAAERRAQPPGDAAAPAVSVSPDQGEG